VIIESYPSIKWDGIDVDNSELSVGCSLKTF